METNQVYKIASARVISYLEQEKKQTITNDEIDILLTQLATELNITYTNYYYVRKLLKAKFSPIMSERRV